MASQEKQQLATEIKNHIEKEGSGYKNWYVGITNDIDKRLFGDHCVSKQSWWIHREARNSAEAREIEEYFFGKGCQGDTGGGDNSTKYVYAYKISSATRE